MDLRVRRPAAFGSSIVLGALLSVSAGGQDVIRRAPNVLIVLIDDAGYGQSGTFGGLVPTPTLDRLADSGLRYTRFHVAAMCSPTRTALLTGRNPHAVGMGAITNWSNDFPGCTASIPKSAAMVSEVLRQNGLRHRGHRQVASHSRCGNHAVGPLRSLAHPPGLRLLLRRHWSRGRSWHPELTEGTTPVEMQPPPGRRADYTLNENLADKAIRWIQMEKGLTPTRPFFMYYAPGATHAPLQAPKKWIDSFRGQFDMGWDRYREIVLERQKKQGVVPQDTVLTPRPDGLPAWDSLTPDQRRSTRDSWRFSPGSWRSRTMRSAASWSRSGKPASSTTLSFSTSPATTERVSKATSPARPTPWRRSTASRRRWARCWPGSTTSAGRTPRRSIPPAGPVQSAVPVHRQIGACGSRDGSRTDAALTTTPPFRT